MPLSLLFGTVTLVTEFSHECEGIQSPM